MSSLAGQLGCQQPNHSLYTFEGTLNLRLSNSAPRQVSPLSPVGMFADVTVYCIDAAMCTAMQQTIMGIMG
jgi:hypothetical protein